jgi:hypothetical protein
VNTIDEGHLMAGEAITVGKWEVGFSSDKTFLRFPFTDRPALILAISHDQAVALARAILDQNAPSTIRKLS